MPERVLKKSLLEDAGVFILDCGADIFVWIGRKSPRLVRAAAMRLSGELFLLLNRPKCTQVTKVLQGTEPVVFKTKFQGWDDVLSVDFNKRGKVRSTYLSTCNNFAYMLLYVQCLYIYGRRGFNICEPKEWVKHGS
jgi:hypothetical protein